MDMCGFPKDNFFYYQAWWGSKPALHLFPHWNWEGKEGQEIEVWVHSNLDRVELFLNGQSQGAQEVVRNTHLEWKVKYAPGALEARGYKDGQQALIGDPGDHRSGGQNRAERRPAAAPGQRRGRGHDHRSDSGRAGQGSTHCRQ